MARSRIPGPLQTQEDDALSDDLSGWPRGLGRAHRHHRPGPIGFERQKAFNASGVTLRRGGDDETLYSDLKTWEGCVPYMYLDTVGLVTVGIGNLLKTVDAAKALPFIDTSNGEAATDAAVEIAYAAVSKVPAGLHWSKYRLSPSLELSDETSRDLALTRIDTEFLPGLRRAFPNFDTYPESAQRFMIDMAYNGGVGYFRKRNMVGLIQQRQWNTVISCLPTHGNPRRNAWRERLLRQAVAEDSP